MRSINDGRVRSQISFLRRQFLQDSKQPFGDALSSQVLSRALATIEEGWVDRVYTPLTTLWVFLGQVLSADHSCRAAVARLIDEQPAEAFEHRRARHAEPLLKVQDADGAAGEARDPGDGPGQLADLSDTAGLVRHEITPAIVQKRAVSSAWLQRRPYPNNTLGSWAMQK